MTEPHISLDEIRRELSNDALPNDRVGGLLTLDQERWLLEQHAELDAAHEHLMGVNALQRERISHLEEQLEALQQQNEALLLSLQEAAPKVKVYQPAYGTGGNLPEASNPASEPEES